MISIPHVNASTRYLKNGFDTTCHIIIVMLIIIAIIMCTIIMCTSIIMNRITIIASSVHRLPIAQHVCWRQVEDSRSWSTSAPTNMMSQLGSMGVSGTMCVSAGLRTSAGESSVSVMASSVSPS